MPYSLTFCLNEINMLAMTELLHPGVYFQETSFSDFEPFINTGDAPPEIRQKFVEFLGLLHQKTKEVWVPACCHSIEWVEDKANELIQELNLEIDIEPRSWAGDGHFWLAAKINGYNKEFVVDPTGVITPGQDYYKRPGTITPFFGDKDHAPSYSRHIYESGKPLNEGVYHVFHP